MSLASKNIFQKHPVPGSDLLSKLLNQQITAKQATEEFRKHDISISERTIQRHIKKMRQNEGNASSIIPVNHKSKPQKSFESYLSDIKAEFNAIDYSDVKKVDPIIINYKNLMKLEILMSRMEFDDNIKGLGDIIELERRISTEIHKMAPNTEEIDYNDLFRKNDLAVEFIMILDKKHKKLDVKQSWIDFIKIHENL